MVADPHAWFSPRNVAVYVNNILKALEQLDPGHRNEFRARAKLFLQQLRILDAWSREQVSQIPPERRILVTTHDAFNYFCNEYRFNAANNYLSIAPVGWSTGSEVGGGMTPRDGGWWLNRSRIPALRLFCGNQHQPQADP